MQKDNEKFSRPMISCKAMTKTLYRNSEKSFLECDKSGFKKHLPVLLPRKSFLKFVLLICNHTVFSFNLKLRTFAPIVIAHAIHWSSVRTESKTRQNIELMTFALT